jgi:hypothetical protein
VDADADAAAADADADAAALDEAPEVRSTGILGAGSAGGPSSGAKRRFASSFLAANDGSGAMESGRLST